ncbi:MAG: hypothetical protein ACREQ2_01015 [Candidatus Binatia bacterium]
MDNSGRLFEGDVIAPEQYLEIFTRTNNLEPEQELILAILADAIECILKYCDEPIPMRAKLFKEAQEWLFDQNEKDPFSFLNVCEILNFDASYLRRGIQAKIQARSVQISGQSKRKTDRLKRVGGQVKLRSHSSHRSRAGL